MKIWCGDMVKNGMKQEKEILSFPCVRVIGFIGAGLGKRLTVLKQTDRINTKNFEGILIFEFDAELCKFFFVLNGWTKMFEKEHSICFRNIS